MAHETRDARYIRAATAQASPVQPAVESTPGLKDRPSADLRSQSPTVELLRRRASTLPASRAIACAAGRAPLTAADTCCPRVGPKGALSAARPLRDRVRPAQVTLPRPPAVVPRCGWSPSESSVATCPRLHKKACSGKTARSHIGARYRE